MNEITFNQRLSGLIGKRNEMRNDFIPPAVGMHYKEMNYYTDKSIILDISIDNRSIEFHNNKKLNDSIADIRINGTEDIYYKGEAENEDVKIKFEKLLKCGGWIHFGNGTSFEISKHRIRTIKLYADSLGVLKRIDRKSIERKYGKPSKIEETKVADFFGLDDDGDILYYKDYKMSFQIDPNTENIKEIRIW